MARRNSQDQYNMAQIMWERMRDPNLEPEPTPQSKDPHVVLRRRDGKTVRVHPKIKRAA